MLSLTQDKHATLREVVAQIHRRDGCLTARALLEEARPPSSPLHNGFGWIWDDQQAAETQRLSHARSLIASIRVEVSHTRRVIAAPVYINPKRTGEFGYLSASQIRSDHELSIHTAAREIRRAASFVQRAQGVCMRLNVHSDLFDVIDSLELLADSIEQEHSVGTVT